MKKNVFVIALTVFVSFISVVTAFRLLLSNYQTRGDSENKTEITSPTPTHQISPSPTPPQKISIVFSGDTMFDRHIRTNSRKNGYDFILENLTPILNEASLVVTNLEGPITDFPSRSEGSEVGSTDNYFFTFDPQITSTLKKNNIKLVNLGNNHILNFGKNGLEQTITQLDEEGISYFGNTGTDLVSDYKVVSLGKLNIAFVNHNQFVPGGKEKTLETLQNLSINPDLTIVYAHWGNEYQTTANTTIQNIAYQFIDAGADLVIGSHPHVVQQSEIYKNKTIYYSLGNFVFDQYFSHEVSHSIILKTEIDPTNLEITFEEIPIVMTKDGKTNLMYNEVL